MNEIRIEEKNWRRIIMMDNGWMDEDGKNEEVLKKKRMRDVYGISERIMMVDGELIVNKKEIKNR